MIDNPEKESPPDSGTPLVLMVNGEEWTARSLESILKPEGYAVLRAYTGQQGLDLAESVRPDVLLVALRLPDMKGVDLCARLRDARSVQPSTPALLLATEPVGRQGRVAAYRAGVWGILHPPFSPAELLARLAPFIAAKRHADAIHETAYIDAETGFYNLQGLLHRMTEIKAETTRARKPLACVMVAPDPGKIRTEGQTDTDVAKLLASVLLSATRLSDAVARVGEGSFVIVAPGADIQGATLLADRVRQAAAKGGERNEALKQLRVRTGFHAVSGSEIEPVIPEELLRRAQQALQEGGAPPQASSDGGRLGPIRLDPN